MHLDAFELHRPTSVEETLRLATEWEGKFDYLAGGTDLLPNYKMHINLRPHLISLDAVAELSGHSLDRIGAMERLGDLERDPACMGAYPSVADAVREVATPLVRASGTVGGNLLVETRCFFFNQSYFWRASLGFCLKADGDQCHVVPQKERCYATFSGDLAPAFLVLGTQVEVAGPGGRRRIPLAELYDERGDGIRRLTIRPGELLVALHLPPESRRLRGRYRKLRVRPSYDFPELGVAVAGAWDDRRVESLSIAMGGVEPYPRKFDELTSPLIGETLSEDRVAALAESITKAVRPVHNTFLQPDYRRRMVGVYVRRAIDEARGAVAA
jgi:4-hydroxybenzoyl-CoA reductase subunit beta